MRIKKKIYLVFLIILAFNIIIGLLSSFAIYRLGNTASEVVKIDTVQYDALMKMKVDSLSAHLTLEEVIHENIDQNRIKDVQQSFNRVITLSTSLLNGGVIQNREIFPVQEQRLRNRIAALRVLSEKLKDQANKRYNNKFGNNAINDSHLVKVAGAIFDDILVTYKELELMMQANMQESVGDMNQTIKFTVIFIVASALILFTVVVFGGLILSNQIIVPLHKTIEYIEKLVSGSGDLTINVFQKKLNCSQIRQCGDETCKMYGTENNSCMYQVGSLAPKVGNTTTCPTIVSGKLKSCYDCQVMKRLIKDELDHLAFTVDTFVVNIRNIIIKVKEASLSLSSSTDEMSATLSTFTKNAQESAASTEEISSSLEQVSASNHQSLSNISEFNKLIALIVERINESMIEVGRVTSKLSDAIEVKKSLDNMLTSIQEMIANISLQMDKALKVSRDTETIIDSVTGISEEVGLLSLNAAIEAARAGEHGRGFAIVADQVGKLSEETQRYVGEITEKIANTTNAVTATGDEIAKIIDSIQSVINEISSFGKIVEEINRITLDDNKLKETIQSDSRIMKSNSETIERSIKELSVSSDEIGKSMVVINNVIQSTASGSEEMTANSKEIANVAEILRDNVEKFKIN